MLKLDIDTWVRFIIWLTLGKLRKTSASDIANPFETNESFVRTLSGFIIYVFYSVNHSVQGKKDALKEQSMAAITGQQNGVSGNGVKK